VLVKLPEINFIDDKDGKPIGIEQHIGRRPIAAFGNSDGDLQMLQYTGAGSGPRFCLYVHHTDAEREYAYDRKDSLARLDKGLDEAAAKGWAVVSMKLGPPTQDPRVRAAGGRLPLFNQALATLASAHLQGKWAASIRWVLRPMLP